MPSDKVNNVQQQSIVASGKSRREQRVPRPSLLGTTEFKFYYLLYITVVPYMAYSMYQASSPQRPEYALYEHELSPGWMFGRKIDLSDGQWDMFRSHLPTFTLAMSAFVIFNRTLYQKGRFQRCVVLSGTSVLFIGALAGGNYLLAKRLAGRRWAPLVFWAYNIAMLFSNERYRGYSFKSIATPLAWMDDWRGIMRRWDITFNLTMLRMVSFDMDYHWRVCRERDMASQQLDNLALSVSTAKERIEQPSIGREYCFTNYWAYLMYPPLYMTGPIITFNDFVAQMRKPSVGSWRTTVLYGVRLVVAALLMELILHTVHCVAISKWAQWNYYSVFEISLMAYMRLTFIWLKLLIIWRFARFWAMADGLDTVENMRRCMSTNYSLQQFWRDWHCSYNRWLVRYLYIPLGGRNTSPWNIFVVFTFVALWHDLSMRLLQWGWIIALLFLPEGLATWYFARPRWSESPHFRYICAVGGALNIIGMMIGNLVGFGDAGVDKMLTKIFSRESTVFLAVTYPILICHLQMVFELREHEYRKQYYATHRRQMC
ncbi:MBOAT-domain-containing protein [Coemansia reversa NRRL 1564]|uniref:MBOAT-domain-containing protein n=1 Tax=Coemansia reversa (strain ATCC 12441 / NRRL 1564) TaxID=763665 RepID=A0A2G5B8W3_COERN|nr:MBOAT-domain-containing protein [Coemansia reversa NRRL 1564]|eukprot:PIA15430.1 MBOAT-domain-containing protein [Coemansia reversa NRRL 1564]